MATKRVSLVASGATVPQIAHGCETMHDILASLLTVESFTVTLLGEALAVAEHGTTTFDAPAHAAFIAMRAADQAHCRTLAHLGGHPLTNTFTLPTPNAVTDTATFLTTMIHLEEVLIAAYLTAAQEWTALGQTRLAQLTLQIGAIHSEHRTVARFFAIEAGLLSGTPNDVAWEKALFVRVADAVQELARLGFLEGPGATITYPGTTKFAYTGVYNLHA